MIFVISINAEINGSLNTENFVGCLAQMKDFFQTTIGSIDYENPPANSYKDFFEFV